MSGSLFDKIINEIAGFNDHVEKVMLYLDCEPLVDRRLHTKVRKLKEVGMKKVNIATNGSILHEHRAVELIESGLDEIYITIDSLNKNIYEKIRVGLKFDVVMDNAKQFIRLRDKLNPELRIRIQAIILKENHREVDAIKDYWMQLLKPADQVVIQKAHNWGNTVEVMKFGDEDGINNIPCKSLWGTCVVHADGQIGLCTMDTSMSVALGDVNGRSIEQIWDGDAISTIREKHLDAQRNEVSICDGCTHWREEKREINQPKPD